MTDKQKAIDIIIDTWEKYQKCPRPETRNVFLRYFKDYYKALQTPDVVVDVKEIKKQTYHQVALYAQAEANNYAEDGLKEGADALSQFADNLWLRINDFDIER